MRLKLSNLGIGSLISFLKAYKNDLANDSLVIEIFDTSNEISSCFVIQNPF